MTSRPDAGGGASRGTTSMCREIQRLDIAFKEPMATVKAGDMLSGSIQMDIVQEFKIKGTFCTCIVCIKLVYLFRAERNGLQRL